MSIIPLTSPSMRFWQRQFAPQISVGQITFDLVFGIAPSIVCLCFDPIVFRGSIIGDPMLLQFTISAHFAIGLAFVSLATWLLFRWPPAVFAGLLSGSAIFATLLGLVLFPASVIGLMAVIGVLGFSPFATAFVFGRNAWRAYCSANRIPPFRHYISVSLGLLISLTIPCGIQAGIAHQMSGAMKMVLSADPAEVEEGVEILKRYRGFTSFNQIVMAHQAESDEARRQSLEATYFKVMGEKIEMRIDILND